MPRDVRLYGPCLPPEVRQYGPWLTKVHTKTKVGPNRVEIQGHFKYLGSITQGNGGQDQEIQSRINAASQVFRSLKKSVFTSNHVDLTPNCTFTAAWCSHASCTGLQSHGLPGCPTGDLPEFLHAPHDGPVPGHRGPLHS